MVVNSEFLVGQKGPGMGAFLGPFDQLKSVQLVIRVFLFLVSQSAVIPLSKNRGDQLKFGPPCYLLGEVIFTQLVSWSKVVGQHD